MASLARDSEHVGFVSVGTHEPEVREYFIASPADCSDARAMNRPQYRGQLV
jgi:hypothetical protein